MFLLGFLKDSHNNLFKLTMRLLLLTAIACGFVILRMAITNKVSYVFLIWNVFLAWIPLCFSIAFTKLSFKWKHVWLIVGFLWLIFYPNAPYMITDFIHLSRYTFIQNLSYGAFNTSFLMWYDFFIISMFIIMGMVLSFVSLSLIHQYVCKKYNRIIGWGIVGIVSCLSGYAIFLGRFIRLNSWNVLTHPKYLIDTVVQSMNHRTLGFTFLFGALTFMIYLIFYLVSKYHSIVNE